MPRKPGNDWKRQNVINDRKTMPLETYEANSLQHQLVMQHYVYYSVIVMNVVPDARLAATNPCQHSLSSDNLITHLYGYAECEKK